MAAFKAAKPGSRFEDFLQLHPPRDVSQLINSRDSKSPDHFWREIWDNIEAHPAEDQKPLFDYTREAEKVSQKGQFKWLCDVLLRYNMLVWSGVTCSTFLTSGSCVSCAHKMFNIS